MNNRKYVITIIVGSILIILICYILNVAKENQETNIGQDDSFDYGEGVSNNHNVSEQGENKESLPTIENELIISEIGENETLEIIEKKVAVTDIDDTDDNNFLYLDKHFKKGIMFLVNSAPTLYNANDNKFLYGTDGIISYYDTVTRFHDNDIISTSYYVDKSTFWSDKKSQWVTLEEYGDSNDMWKNTGKAQLALVDKQLESLFHKVQFDYDFYEYPNHEMYETNGVEIMEEHTSIESARNLNSFAYNPYGDYYIATYYEDVPIVAGGYGGTNLMNIMLFDNEGKEIKRFACEDVFVRLIRYSWNPDNIMILSENEIYVYNEQGNSLSLGMSAYINVETGEVYSKYESESTEILQMKEENIIHEDDTMYLEKGLLFHQEDESFYQVNKGELIFEYSIESIKKELGVEELDYSFRDIFYYEEKYLYFNVFEENGNVKIYRHTVGIPESLEYVYTWEKCELTEGTCMCLSSMTDCGEFAVIEHEHEIGKNFSKYLTILQIKDKEVS